MTEVSKDIMGKLTKYDDKIDDFISQKFLDKSTKELIQTMCSELLYIKNVISKTNPYECKDFSCENKIYLRTGDHTIEFVRFRDTFLNSNDIIQENQMFKILTNVGKSYLSNQNFTDPSFKKLLKSQIILGFFYYYQEYHDSACIKVTKLRELNIFTKSIVKIVKSYLSRMDK